MRLKFVILALAAEISVEGKLSLIGGDFRTVQVSTLPAICPTFSVVAKFYALPAEWGQQQGIDLRLTSPNGEALGSCQLFVTPVANQLNREEESDVGLVATFQQVPLPRAGRYRIAIMSGDQMLGDVPMDVILQPPE